MINKYSLFISFLLGISNEICVADAQSGSEEIFTNIYEQGVWGGQWFSGGGSTVQASAPYVNILVTLLKKLRIKSVVDLGCGDWQFSRYIDWNGINYLGYDVVKHIVESNQKKFAKNNIIFKQGDFISDDIPGADLLLCKEVLQHLTNEDVHHFIKQCMPKFRYCLIVNQVNSEDKSSANPNQQRGDTRPIDLTKAPFYVKGKVLLVYESEPNVFKQVLWVEND